MQPLPAPWPRPSHGTVARHALLPALPLNFVPMLLQGAATALVTTCRVQVWEVVQLVESLQLVAVRG